MRFPAWLVLLIAAFVARVNAADQADNAIMVAMKLSASPNYSWTTTTEQAGGASVTRGQTNPNGYSLIVFNARPLASATTSGLSVLTPESGPETTTIFKGDSTYVLQDGNSWSLPEKTPAAIDPTPTPTSTTARGQGARGGSASGRRTRGRSNSSTTDPTATDNKTAGGRWLPPAGLNLPHEELAIIVANYTNMQFAGDVVSGKLTEYGADLLLLPPGSTQVPPKDASGTFRLWITNGVVTKYEIKLMAKQTPSGREIKGGFAETVTVELSEIGTTKWDVPIAAKQKLGL